MIKAYIFDLDGTLFFLEDKVPFAINGAIELISQLKKQNIPHLFVTNTTSKSAKQIYDIMKKIGFDVDIEQIITPIVVAKKYLQSKGYKNIAIESCKNLETEFSEFEISNTPQAVVITDEGNGLSYEAVNRVMNWGLNKIELICLQKNKFYKRNNKLVADLGFYVTGFEYVTGQKIKNFGKPSIELFTYACNKLGFKISKQIAMVGDDIEFDVLGAMQLGFAGILVKTGKYIEGIENKFKTQPNRIINSVKTLCKK